MKNSSFCFIFFFFLAALHGQEKKLILYGSPSVDEGESETIEGITFCSLFPPGSREELAKQISPLLIRKTPLSKIKQEIVLYYQSEKHPIVTVLVPEQDSIDGTPRLTVIESKVGKITAIGQRHFSEKSIEKEIRLQPGSPIDTSMLLEDLAWINKNPFRKTSVILSPGEAPGTTDIELSTKDRLPLRMYLGGDNTGNPITGRSRYFTGINWGNAFGWGHQLSFQWTTSENFHKFNAYTGNYTAPLPWRHTLNFFGGYTSFKPELVGLKNTGWSAQASGRYILPIGKKYGILEQDLQFGYDFKETNNNLAFADTPDEAIETKNVSISQFVFIYDLNYRSKRNQTNFEINLYASPFQNWYEHQNAASYNLIQPGASPLYLYILFGANEEFTFPKHPWSLFFQARGQISSKILLPSEQFGLGGYNTVRGYLERTVNYDNGICLNFELRTPPFSLLRLFSKKPSDAFHFLFFVDYGYGAPRKKEKPVNHLLDPPDKTLLGIGPGIRYKVTPYFSSRFDVGFPLTQVNGSKKTPHIHFGLALSY